MVGRVNAGTTPRFSHTSRPPRPCSFMMLGLAMGFTGALLGGRVIESL
jgi:hypothetical protein